MRGWDLDTVKVIFRSFSFFFSFCFFLADSVNNLLIVYLLPILQAT